MSAAAEAMADRARAMGERVAAPQPDAKPLVYVSGPITADPLGCVRQALPVFAALRQLGCTPFLPQLSVIAEMVEHQPYEEWMAYDLDVIAHCDALVRLPGHSPGADREVDAADGWGIPTFHVPHPSRHFLPPSIVEWRDRWTPGWKVLATAIARTAVVTQAETGSGRR